MPPESTSSVSLTEWTILCFNDKIWLAAVAHSKKTVVFASGRKSMSLAG
jgi:hypothetical protein